VGGQVLTAKYEEAKPSAMGEMQVIVASMESYGRTDAALLAQ
jgi:hypothetical protein